MRRVRIVAGPFTLIAKLEEQAAPATCTAFAAMLPFRRRMIQARWSGEAGWVPLGDLRIPAELENATSEPRAGHFLMYPGGISEAEILLPYGITRFACKAGGLAGSHFLTVIAGGEHLGELGRLLLWKGAQDIQFSAM